MTKLFAVVVATVPEYYAYKQEHPEHDRDQIAWFKQQYKQGNLLCCGSFFLTMAQEFGLCKQRVSIKLGQ
ncbi:MAG: hypothetical protein AAGF83_01945 [Cyanobacteria bacterium P01_G01_bin.67]